MRIKVFQAANMSSALRQIKESLGPEALILSTKTIKNGKLGIFGKPVIEVTAAIDDAKEEEFKQNQDKEKHISDFDKNPQEEIKKLENYMRASWSGKYLQSSPQEGYIGFKKKSNNSQNTIYKEQADVSSLQKEIRQLQSMLKNLRQDISTQQCSGIGLDVHRPTCPVTKSLIARGLDMDVALSIADLMKQHFSEQELQDQELFNVCFQEILGQWMHIDNFHQNQGHTSRCIALLGPTGVGKTTTIAKIAASYLHKFGKNIALVTIDNYRIAAVEQLKIYAEIMGLPLEVVTSAIQLNQVLDYHKNKDLILIDTAGRSPNDDMSLNDLKAFLDSDYEIENHLVLSTTTKENDLEKIVQRFQILPLHSLIFTKLDESNSYGLVLNIHYRTQYPLSYLTNGQRVPEDLTPADPKSIAKLILENSKD